MFSAGTQRALVVHPTPIFLATTFALAFFALEVASSFVPLILLLAVLRLFVIVVVTHQNAVFKLVLVTICLAAATTLANIGPSLHAVPEIHAFGAIISLFLLTLLTSILIVAAVLLDMSLRSSTRRQWSQFILFPTVWSTVLLIAASISPLGYLAIWNPVVGISGYGWMRPMLGPTGVDWVVGAWAAVISDLVATWIMASSDHNDEQGSLISTSDGDEVDRPEKPQTSPWLLCMVILLCLGTAPSYFGEKIPTPVNSELTVPLPVACALPFIGNNTRSPSLDEFLAESTILTSLAKVVLWPEGAVFFETEVQKKEAIAKIAGSAGSSVVGVSFVDHANDTKQGDKLRNGFMLVDRKGLVFEYFKRHLVPFVESNAMVAYSSPPALFDYHLVTKRNSRHKPIEFLEVPITVSICMDFAHPMPFNNLAHRPSLILGPSHTWHPSIGLAMWEQAKARAEEVGSAVLWCDGGEQGISGVGGRGMNGGEVIQVGLGSWVRTIGLEKDVDDKKTPYTYIGPWLTVMLMWLVFGTEKVAEIGLRAVGKGQNVPNVTPGPGNGLRKKIVDTYLAWRKGRQADAAADEHTHLL